MPMVHWVFEGYRLKNIANIVSGIANFNWKAQTFQKSRKEKKAKMQKF